MADNVKVLAGVGDSTVAPPVATDDIGGIHFQKIKAGWGADGVFQETTDTDGLRLPIGGSQVGALVETAPASDTASSGLNGRLQRIAQRLTSLIALLPAALGAGGGLKVDGSGTALPVSGTVAVSGTVPTSATQLPATLGQKTMANGLAVTVASDQSALATTAAQLPATLGQKAMAASLAVVLASDQAAVLISVARREILITATVPSGSNNTPTVDTTGYGNIGLVVPPEFDGSQITFIVSADNTLFYPLYDITNTLVSMSVVPSRAYDLPGELMAWRYIRISCVTTQATTNTVFQLALRS